MAYKYTNASLSITSISQKQSFINDFQEALNDQFYNSSDVWTIQEETPKGSFLFEDIDVRVNDGIEPGTGVNLGDDFKRILFREVSHSSTVGTYYKFDDNYWIVTNTQNIKNLAASIMVRRCNNMLRWMDKDGSIYSVPCYIDYDIKENKDYQTAGTALVLPSGFIEVSLQLNATTNKIKTAQRFLFGRPGNWVAYKVMGGGINNFHNLKTDDNTSGGLLQLSMSSVAVNETGDDVVNGIADVNQHVYTLELSHSNISGNPGETLQLSMILKLNDETISTDPTDLTWTTDDDTVANVEDGLITFIHSGKCTITGTLKDNSSVYATVSVETVSIPVVDFQVVISPSTNYVYENEYRDYEVKLYRNLVLQATEFAFSVPTSTVPVGNYTITAINGNKFRLTNLKMYMEEPLTIHFYSFDNLYSKDLEVWLKGAY